MIRIGVDTSEEELPDLVRDGLRGKMSFLHISGTGIEYLPLSEQVERVRNISQRVGNLTLSTSESNSNVWLLDNNTSPNTQIMAHTDNPFKDKPEDVVAFWSIRTSAVGGENIITPFERIVELGEQSGHLSELIEQAQASFTFAFAEHEWTGPVLDFNKKTVRYDKKYLTTPDTELSQLFEGATAVGDSIRLIPGEVIFVNNATAVHARLPYSDQNRLSLRTRINL